MYPSENVKPAKHESEQEEMVLPPDGNMLYPILVKHRNKNINHLYLLHI